MIARVTEYRQLPVEQLKMELSDILDQNRASEWLRVGGGGGEAAVMMGLLKRRKLFKRAKRMIL
ncbi:hypothetical protein KY285_009814 [Solanum tuberosum]|nr:hypothetical protein KY285_009814 [Solanum tuberosum]